MRTSLNEIEHIEKWIHGQLPPADGLLMQARIITSPELKTSVNIQKWVYRLLRIRWQRHLKREAEAVHEQFFQKSENESFRVEITRLFKE